MSTFSLPHTHRIANAVKGLGLVSEKDPRPRGSDLGKFLPSRRRFDPLWEPQHEGGSSPNIISLGVGEVVMICLVKNEQFFKASLSGSGRIHDGRQCRSQKRNMEFWRTK